MKTISTYREADGGMITLESHTSLKSTAILAREYAKQGYPDRYVVYTERLTKLKTAKKNVEVDAEAGLFMTCILRPSIFPSQASMLGAMSAAAAVSALEEHTDKHLGIGWVSDIYCEGTRIGKVSIEGKLDDYTTFEYILVSFECRMSKTNFPHKLGDMMNAVFSQDQMTVTKIIAKDVIARFFKLYASIKTPAKFMSEYTDRFALRGKRVKYKVGQKWKSYKVLTVDSASGALVLDNGRDGEIRVTSPALIMTPKKFKVKR